MAINGEIVHPAPNSDSFWSEGIDRPYWANDENFVKKIGKMSFHNVDGDQT
jgi:spore germination cell wall hydrolase CwlJ-like protein